MTYEEVKTRLNKVFCKVFNDDNMVINEKTSAKDIEKWDSLTHLTLISDIEEAFGIKFKLNELIAMKTVGDYIKTIQAKVS